MGEFQNSFGSIRSNDLKHIYSGFPKPVIRMRASNPYPTQEQLRIQAEKQDLKTYVLKSTEFVPEYDCLIPRAPAFRILSRHEVSNLVTRLSQPTIASKGIANTSDRLILEESERAHSKYMGLRTVNEEEMGNIVTRLSKKTRSAVIREHQNKTRLSDVN